jgi:hypothetical protein
MVLPPQISKDGIDVPEVDKQRMMCDNAATLYGFA